MRRTRILTAVMALAAGLLAGSPLALAAPSAAEVKLAAETYSWSNVEIVGGGFVPGIVFNEGERGLVYARTDIGGAYRWQPRAGVGAAAGPGRLGPVGLDRRREPRGRPGGPGQGVRRRRHVHERVGPGQRRDPAVRRPRAHLAAGRRCRSSSAATCPAAAWASGSPSTRTATRSCTSARPAATGCTRAPTPGDLVAGGRLPQPGNYAQDPADTTGYDSDNQGVVWVTFDQAHGLRRGGRRRRSTSGSRTRRTPSTAPPTAGDLGAGCRAAHRLLAHKGVLSDERRPVPADQRPGGPYDGGKGEVWRLATATGTWTQVSPAVAEAGNYFGYSGLSVDRQRPGTLMVDGVQLLVAGHADLPQHRQRRHLDPGLGVHAAIRTSRPLHDGRLRRRPG